MSDDWRDRCDWCGWPLARVVTSDRVVKGGCVDGNCSQRPMPKLNEVGELRQEVRKLEEAASDALVALATLPEDVLGYGDDRWPLRDEMQAKLRRALGLEAA